MNLKKVLSGLPVALALSGVACNGGSHPSPATTTQYGQVVSISPQQLANITVAVPVLGPITANIGSPLATGLVASITGKYFDQSAPFPSPNYVQANVLFTNESFNYDPAQKLFSLAILTSLSRSESYDAYAIQYSTPGQNSTTDPAQVKRTASGLIIVPNSITAASPPKGVVVYFHPTTFGKNQVPSCLGSLSVLGIPGNASANMPAYCNFAGVADVTGIGLFAVLAATYANAGFVVVAPDYVGQGADIYNVHPYVAYPENNALAAFNMFPALRQILAESYGIQSSTKLPLLITGYSEGGGYALKAAQLAQTTQESVLARNNITLTLTAPQEGAYSLVDQMNFAFDNNSDGLYNCAARPAYDCGNTNMMESFTAAINPVVGTMNNWNVVSAQVAAQYKPELTAYVLTAAMYYDFHNVSDTYDYSMNHQFWSQITMPGGTIANLYQLFSGNYVFTGNQIAAALISNASSIGGYNATSAPTITTFDPVSGESQYSPGSGQYGLNNQATLFINGNIAHNPTFEIILDNGSTYNWTTKTPINFIHMNYDSVVTVVNTMQAYSCMKNGVSFSGNNYLIRSSGLCTAAASGNLIESTIIQNFQMTNNLVQLSPGNAVANSQFWGGEYQNKPTLGVPFDHPDMFVLGNIAAMCNFRNVLESGINVAHCPS